MLHSINHKCYSNNLELLVFFFYEFDNSIFLAKYSFRFYYPLKTPSKIHTITTGEVSGHVVSNKSVNRKQGSNKKCLFRLMSFVVAYSELFTHPILMAFVCIPVVFLAPYISQIIFSAYTHDDQLRTAFLRFEIFCVYRSPLFGDWYFSTFRVEQPLSTDNAVCRLQ